MKSSAAQKRAGSSMNTEHHYQPVVYNQSQIMTSRLTSRNLEQTSVHTLDFKKSTGIVITGLDGFTILIICLKQKRRLKKKQDNPFLSIQMHHAVTMDLLFVMQKHLVLLLRNPNKQTQLNGLDK